MFLIFKLKISLLFLWRFASEWSKCERMDAYNFICKIPEDKRSLFCPILDYKLIKNVSVLGTRINYTIYAVLPKKGGRGGGLEWQIVWLVQTFWNIHHGLVPLMLHYRLIFFYFFFYKKQIFLLINWKDTTIRPLQRR